MFNFILSPCVKEREMSIQCLELRRENDSINCTDYFENFKTCKKFWVNQIFY
jgi:hypothetical protein